MQELVDKKIKRENEMQQIKKFNLEKGVKRKTS
jgi:hypothetical protein